MSMITEVFKSHPRRAAMWCGLILAPAAFLLLFYYSVQCEDFLGLTRGRLSSGWLYFYFPLSGVPFVWLREGGWLKKTGLSLAYVVFCYGSAVLAFIIFINLVGRV